MTWPERYDPFGVPTDWDEFRTFALWTSVGTAFWSAKYAADVWHTIPRMASHKYANPSRNAIVRHAARETAMMSSSRMLLLSGVARALTPLAIVEGAILFGSLINAVAPTPKDAPIPEMTLRAYPNARRV